MRLATGLLAFALPLVIGCAADGMPGGDDTSGDDTVDPPPPEYGFQIITPDIEIQPGEEVTYCYYTTVTSEQAMGIKKWSSSMTPGSHHMIVFMTNSPQAEDGHIEEGCGFGASISNLPIWTYSAQTPEWEMALPDGVGMSVKATQNLFVQMHYLNTHPTDSIMAHVTLNGEAYAPDEEFIPAAAFATYDTDIDVPSGQTSVTEGSCTVPAGANFFQMSTHSHRFTTRTEVWDGNAMIFESGEGTDTNWEHPGATYWMEAPHYTFDGQLRYRCEYFNPPDSGVPNVGEGDSARTDEMCMAIGYFFPSTTSRFCYNGFTL